MRIPLPSPSWLLTLAQRIDDAENTTPDQHVHTFITRDDALAAASAIRLLAARLEDESK
jgi:hypothetical protein